MLRVLARWTRGLLALGVLAAFTAGVPWLLVLAAGWPLQWLGWPHPTAVPSTGALVTALTNPWSDAMVLAVLATCGWLLWALFVRDVIAEIIIAGVNAAEIRAGGHRPPTGGHGPVRMLAAVLIGAIVGAILLATARGVLGSSAPAAAAAEAAAHRPAVAVAPANPIDAPLTGRGASPVLAPVARPVPMSLTVTVTADPDVPEWAAGAPGGVHRVVRDDNLWDIAKTQLGDPYRWREIYLLNRGHAQAGGYALTDPDEIDIGWVLALPARDPGQPAPTPPPVDPAPTPPADSDPAPDPGAAPSTGPSASPSAAPSTGASGTPSAGATSPAPSGNDATTAPSHHHDEHGVTLPSQGWISLGLATTIASVAALVRLHARRRARLGFPVRVRTEPETSDIPEALALADLTGDRHLGADASAEHPRAGVVAAPPAVAAPIGLDAGGGEVSLFDLPGPALPSSALAANRSRGRSSPAPWPPGSWRAPTPGRSWSPPPPPSPGCCPTVTP